LSTQTITLIGSVLVALLGGGAIKAFFDYLADRRRGKIEEDTNTFKTLVEMNTLLRTELKDVRQELETERRQRVALEIKVRHLEARLGMETDT
jgi:hypothetical protein